MDKVYLVIDVFEGEYISVFSSYEKAKIFLERQFMNLIQTLNEKNLRTFGWESCSFDEKYNGIEDFMYITEASLDDMTNIDWSK